ncbi:hypothetical protein NW762_007267 [Fusarium torreyae]|uniref:Uncharacterized protein n=1 Tax=Fusarium torreyae TaxID=1237075 RepID=A0A9W8S1E6_9HYPO|nr:hypothetical protein NW762_007267 [Fusarium torreyae]
MENELHQSIADQVSEISENMVELMLKADALGDVPEWPPANKIRLLRSYFRMWVQSCGAFLEPHSSHSIEYQFREDQYRCSMIREELTTLNRQSLALHYDERPDFQEPAAIQGLVAHLGETLDRLFNWIDPSTM